MVVVAAPAIGTVHAARTGGLLARTMCQCALEPEQRAADLVA